MKLWDSNAYKFLTVWTGFIAVLSVIFGFNLIRHIIRPSLEPTMVAGGGLGGSLPLVDGSLSTSIFVILLGRFAWVFPIVVLLVGIVYIIAAWAYGSSETHANSASHHESELVMGIYKTGIFGTLAFVGIQGASIAANLLTGTTVLTPGKPVIGDPIADIMVYGGFLVISLILNAGVSYSFLNQFVDLLGNRWIEPTKSGSKD